MRITTEHATSSYGLPVILDDDGHPMDYAPGVRAVRRALGMSTTELGSVVGKSRRTVEDWEQDRYNPPAEALYVLAAHLRLKSG
jgi:DNA-binding XRE family transcriptional regulator